jgi:DNA gyrase inhibitor GyrI
VRKTLWRGEWRDPGGRCAVVRHHGSLDTLAQSIWFLYRDWLPASGETLRDFPVFVTSTVHEVGEHELQTDIYLPLNEGCPRNSQPISRPVTQGVR